MSILIKCNFEDILSKVEELKVSEFRGMDFD